MRIGTPLADPASMPASVRLAGLAADFLSTIA
jgi:hypothetical protein